MSYSTQLTNIDNYDVNNLCFSQVQKNSIRIDPTHSLSYQRVSISTKNADGTIGDLILKTPVLYSFGVQESKSMETKEVNGYVMPLCLWDRNNPSAEEKAWTDLFDKICNRCKEFLVENRNEFGKWDLEMNDLKKFNPLYWKRDKSTGKIMSGSGPTLYTKLISSKRDGVDNILTIFYDADTGEEVNPLSILDKNCHVTAAIKIESIFIGNRISLQVKLWEVEFRLIGQNKRRLLRPASVSATNTPSIVPAPVSTPTLVSKPEPVIEEEDEPLEPSDEDDDEEEVMQQTPPTPAKRAVRGRGGLRK